MATASNPGFDVIADPTPQIKPRPNIRYGRKSIQALADALKTADGTTYSDAKLRGMSYNDLVYACSVNNLTP